MSVPKLENISTVIWGFTSHRSESQMKGEDSTLNSSY